MALVSACVASMDAATPPVNVTLTFCPARATGRLRGAPGVPPSANITAMSPAGAWTVSTAKRAEPSV